VIVDGPIAQPRAKVFSRCAGKPYINGLIGVYELNRVELLAPVRRDAPCLIKYAALLAVVRVTPGTNRWPPQR
jgi:hypothetical protein